MDLLLEGNWLLIIIVRIVKHGVKGGFGSHHIGLKTADSRTILEIVHDARLASTSTLHSLTTTLHALVVSSHHSAAHHAVHHAAAHATSHHAAAIHHSLSFFLGLACLLFGVVLLSLGFLDSLSGMDLVLLHLLLDLHNQVLLMHHSLRPNVVQSGITSAGHL